MKKILENVIIGGFILFFLGGVCLIFIQFFGLIVTNNELVVSAGEKLSWIFPVATISGLLCYLYSYFSDSKT